MGVHGGWICLYGIRRMVQDVKACCSACSALERAHLMAKCASVVEEGMSTMEPPVHMLWLGSTLAPKSWSAGWVEVNMWEDGW